MSDVFITWGMILPPFLIERIFVGLIGGGMFSHFICMASAAPSKTPPSIWAFLIAIVSLSAAMVASAFSGKIDDMWMLLICCLGSMFLFWLWLWYQGMHVKDFLDKKYGTQ